MNVTCEGCGTVYRVDPAKVPVGGVRARCASCDQVFWVRAASADEQVSAAVSAPAANMSAAAPVAPTAPAPREPMVAAPTAPATLPVPVPIEPNTPPSPAVAASTVNMPPAAPAPSPATPTAGGEAAFSPLRTARVDAAPDVVPVSAPEPETATPEARESGELMRAVPSTPAFARPAFGAPTLRPTAPAPSAQELVPPAAVADATRVQPPALPTASVGATERAAVPLSPLSTPLTVPPAPPVRAGAATSALGGILPADQLAVPAPRSAAPAAPPKAPSAPRPPNPFLQQDPAARTRRLARALVSDMVTYHPAKKADGLRDGTLKQLFEEEIRKSWEEYAEQVGRETAESTPHFRDALNDILADGRLIF